MIRINILCALILLLLTSISTYAGVTDGDVTAFRLASIEYLVIFTNNPGHDPNINLAPLGSGYMSGTTCTPGLGFASIVGRVCNGISGDPIETYSCAVDGSTPNASNTTWCLFSESPRTGSKTWAVKYVNGLIPTNDGASIVRCEGVDTFDPVNGCIETVPSEISIEGGFIKLDTTDGNAPIDRNCAETAHWGRMVVDDVGGKLYICTQVGWETITTDP